MSDVRPALDDVLVVVLDDQVVWRVGDLLIREGEELVARVLSVDNRLALLDLVDPLLVGACFVRLEHCFCADL